MARTWTCRCSLCSGWRRGDCLAVEPCLGRGQRLNTGNTGHTQGNLVRGTQIGKIPKRETLLAEVDLMRRVKSLSQVLPAEEEGMTQAQSQKVRGLPGKTTGEEGKDKGATN